MPLLKFVFSSAGPLALAACTTVGPDYAAPDPGGLTASDIQVDGAAKSVDREPAQRWWMVFEDETLNSLIETAFNENRDLRRAAANVEAARSLLNLERVNLRPTGEARAAYQRRRLTGAAFGLDELDFDDAEFFDIGVNAAWELDFFGRVRRATEAALAGAQTAEYLRRDAQVLIAAETARAYIEYRGAALQLDVAKRNLSVQRNSARLTQRRLDEGLGSRLDVARAEAQAKTTEASIPPLEAAQIAAANRLATLTGANVNDVLSALAKGEQALPTPPDALPIGDIEALLQRRADIRAAERTLAAATARIGIAKAEFFPRVTLAGGVSLAAQDLAGVGGDGSIGYGVGPTITWSGFDVPRVRAQVKAAGANAEAALAAYEQSVLVALEETQTSLAAYGRERVRYNALADAAAKAREAAALARQRYDVGADDFLTVLDAEGRLLAADAALAASQTTVTANFVRVYQALGAGWSAE